MAATDFDPGDILTYVLFNEPTGAVVDPMTGLFSWTPSPGQTGNFTIGFEVTDLGGLSDSATFLVVVENFDLPIEIVSTPSGTSLDEGALFTYDVDAIDPDPEDSVTYGLVTAPSGATIDAVTGLIEWTPDFDDSGVRDFVVSAASTGPDFPIDTQSFMVTVNDVNQAPTFTSVAVVDAFQNEPYAYDADADDIDLDMLSYSLTVAPAGMTIDPMSGLVEWTPLAGQSGPNPVTIEVTDGVNPPVEQAFAVNVGQNLVATDRINAAGPFYTDTNLDDWDADRDFSGGQTLSTANSIANTSDETLFQTARVPALGATEFSYSIPVVAGDYEVVLLIADIDGLSPATPNFDVIAEGLPAVTAFDIVALGPDTATEVSFPGRGHRSDARSRVRR